MKWIEIGCSEYTELFQLHDSELHVFASISLPHGHGGDSRRHMMTEWGFKDADEPFLKWEQYGDTERWYKQEPPQPSSEEESQGDSLDKKGV